MAGSQEFIQVARRRVHFLTQQSEQLRRESDAFIEDTKRLEELYVRSRREMASYLLAEVGDAELLALEERLRYPSLRAIKGAFEEKLVQVQAKLAQADADPRIVHYDFHLSQAQDELNEIRDAYDHVNARIQVWHDSEWFKELNGRGYFEPSYEVSLFNMFWDWRAISYLMEELEELHALNLPSPEQIRDTWNDLREEAEPIITLWGDLKARIAELEELKVRYDALKAQPEALFREMYEALSDAVLDHLESCPDELAVQIASDDKHLATFLKKNVGLSKQIAYLKQLNVTRIQPLLQSLSAEMLKLNRKIQKARYKSKYYTPETMAGLRNFKEEKWAKRHRKLGKLRTRISGFNGYKQGSFTDDYLWWDAMTRGAPADDIYEVRTFRRHNPHWNWRQYQPAWERRGSAMDTAAHELTERMDTTQDDDWGLDAS